MVPTAPPHQLSTPGERIGELDVLRGFALCGILVVNVYQQLVFVRGGAPPVFPPVVAQGFVERFLSVFALLFGVGFALFLERAAHRTPHPRRVLARRLAVLLVLGIAHQFFHPGEALTLYALVGLVLLLPMSLLGARACLAVALVLLVVAPCVQQSYGIAVAALALGFALGRLGVPAALGRRPGRVAAVLVVAGLLTLGWWALSAADVRLPLVNVLRGGFGGGGFGGGGFGGGGFGGGGLGGAQSLLPPLAALVGALAYCCALLLLLRTPAGPAIGAVLAPMGRMALTNYLSATALFLLLGPVLGVDAPDDTVAVVGLTVGILGVQAVWSPLWLRCFRYGPVEWAWRCLTWWRRAPLRR